MNKRYHITLPDNINSYKHPDKLFFWGVLIQITHLLLVVLFLIIILSVLQCKQHIVVGGRCRLRKYHGCGAIGYLLVVMTFDVPFTRSPAHQQMVRMTCEILDIIYKQKRS